MRVRVYVDGLNFYYGVSKPYNIKWVDMEKVFLDLLKQKIPSCEIEKIILFSAIVQTKSDSARQRAYFNALQEHCTSFEIKEGYFRESVKWGTPVQPGQGYKPGQNIRVQILEEKGTDVNLACRIVEDAYESANKDFDVACLVSNDGDLAAALKVKQKLRQRTILVLPRTTKGYSRRSYPASVLKRLIPKKDRIYEVPKSLLEKSPLPRTGKFMPPVSEGW